MQELREVVDPTLEEAVEDTAQSPAPIALGSSDGSMRILGFHGLDTGVPSSSNFSETSTYAHASTSRQLCRVYLQQVDPIIKILHRPSLEKWLLLGGTYLQYPAHHSSTEALQSAIHYATVGSLADFQCRDMFDTDKATIFADYRSMCEAALDRSGLLATRDITVLQAFVLYLVGPTYCLSVTAKRSLQVYV